jgi:CheY-like chemotaxis protein
MTKVLVAEDSTTQRKLLTALLQQLSLEPIEAVDGKEALDHLLRPDGPRLALIDWEMPGFSGVEVCKKVRESNLSIRPHLILVTGRSERSDVVQALEAGADDYLTKPPYPAELQARVQVGLRNVTLQNELKQRIEQLEGALRRLEVVGGVAAQSTGKTSVIGARREGNLRPELEVLDAVRALPQRFASVLMSFKGPQGASEPAELWAHLSLALPAQGAWLDVTLAVSRRLAGEAFNRLSGNLATSDQSLLDGVSDVLTLVMRGFQEQLEELGIAVLKPLASRAFVGSIAVPEAPHRLKLEEAGWTLNVVQTAAPVRSAKFQELGAGTVLIHPLSPPKLPDVEVLAKGTILKPSYLSRASAFFRGDAAQTEVSIMDVSAFAKDHRPA